MGAIIAPTINAGNQPRTVHKPPCTLNQRPTLTSKPRPCACLHMYTHGFRSLEASERTVRTRNRSDPTSCGRGGCQARYRVQCAAKYLINTSYLYPYQITYLGLCCLFRAMTSGTRGALFALKRRVARPTTQRSAQADCPQHKNNRPCHAIYKAPRCPLLVALPGMC